MSRVIPPDIALWCCRRLRGEFAPLVPGLQVDIRLPDSYRGEYPLIVVRDDGGTQSARILFDRSIGVTVYRGHIDNPYPCRQLAELVYGSLTDPDIPHEPDSPIAAIDDGGCNGPYPVSGDFDAAIHYMTVSYATVGTIIDQK